MTELTQQDVDAEVQKTIKALEEQGIKTKDEPNSIPETAQEDQKSSPELTEFELEQQGKGWNPDGPKSAEEWARNEPLYEEIKNRGKEIKSLKKTVDSMKALLDKQEQLAYNRALADFKAQRDAAIKQGNVQLVEQIEKQANTIPVPPKPAIPAVEDFRERHNEWLEGTSFGEIKMQKYAQQRDAELMTRGLSPEKHMQVLEEDIKAAFPAYFGVKEKPRDVQAVEGGDSGVVSNSKKRYSLKDLSPEQKDVARMFEKRKVMTIDEYIAKLVQLGDLK